MTLEVDMKIDTAGTKELGQYLASLALEPQSLRPATVKEFMEKFADYLNVRGYFSEPLGRNQPEVRFSEVLAQSSGAADDVVAEFLKNPGEPDTNPIGTWRVGAYLSITNIRENATMNCVNHTADEIVLRLPEPGLLADSVKKAQSLAVLGDLDLMPYPKHVYEYINGTSNMNALGFIYSQIGAYVTSSCR